MRCPKCGQEIPGQSYWYYPESSDESHAKKERRVKYPKYCRYCGTLLPKSKPDPRRKTEKYCVFCGTRMKPGTSFCTKCGRAEPASRTDRSRRKGKKQARSGWLILCLLLLAVGMTGGAAIYYFGLRNLTSQNQNLSALFQNKRIEAEAQLPQDEEKEQMTAADEGQQNPSDSDQEPGNPSSFEQWEKQVFGSAGSVAQETRNSDSSRTYMLYGSDSRYISESELYGFTAQQCAIARNELYARHGRKFKDEKWQKYFSQFDWYHPSIEPEDFKESMLNVYETANRDIITTYEEKCGYR